LSAGMQQDELPFAQLSGDPGLRLLSAMLASDGMTPLSAVADAFVVLVAS